jgi:hypothetical protein
VRPEAISPALPREEENMLKSIVFILVALWLIGFALHVAGAMIHILLGLALVILVIDLLMPKAGTTT